jgi:hypothetical protein
MNVRKGRTPLLPISFRQTTDERGQIASTIWAEESGEGLLSECTFFSGLHCFWLTDEVVDEADLSIALTY